MSYHSPWRWTDGQLEGFKEGLQGLPAEYKVFQMDTKRNSSPEAKEKMGREAMALIEQWKPDLVYTSDDDAQEYVAKHYINKPLPFVFSGVNKAPGAYGFEGSRNVTGVLEQEHFVESVRLLKRIVPGVRKIAVVLDDAPMWDPVEKRMRAATKALPDVELEPWDTILTFEEYKRRIKAYHGTVDAIALIGIFNFKDERGKNVPYQDVLKWTAENSTLPDFGFWIDRVHFGTLAAVTVSEREQGLAAGRIARAILAEGKAPSAFFMRPTVKGLPVVSLARANRLGIKIPSGVLLSAEVIQKFDWEQ
ncbi:MAG: hypothetical protein HYU77_02750 [Betaproteobacteria bacterium]|nr:hypothetical protein [Betaproteobacteria bacterium]